MKKSQTDEWKKKKKNAIADKTKLARVHPSQCGLQTCATECTLRLLRRFHLWILVWCVAAPPGAQISARLSRCVKDGAPPPQPPSLPHPHLTPPPTPTSPTDLWPVSLFPTGGQDGRTDKDTSVPPSGVSRTAASVLLTAGSRSHRVPGRVSGVGGGSDFTHMPRLSLSATEPEAFSNKPQFYSSPRLLR